MRGLASMSRRMSFREGCELEEGASMRMSIRMLLGAVVDAFLPLLFNCSTVCLQFTCTTVVLTSTSLSAHIAIAFTNLKSRPSWR